MTPSEFRTTYGAYADDVAAHLGFNSPELFLAQWALETDWGNSQLCTQYNNLAGINYNGVACYQAPGGFAGYKGLSQFVLGYLYVLNLNGYGYPAVLASKDGTLTEQCTALGNSGWAASHYNDGNGAGSSLSAFASELGSGTVTPTPAPAPEQTPTEYTVVEGDNLSEIAVRFGLTLSQIESYNPELGPANGRDFGLIYPGNIVHLTPPANAPVTSTSYPYTVKPGDTLWAIAQDHGVTLSALESANPEAGPNFNLIHPGQVINIPR